MPSETIFIEGLPATFATKKEIPWRQKLLEYERLPQDKGYIGIKMLFILPTLEPKGHPLDVDNLCEPVFSVLINKRGLFRGRRPNIQWWRALKKHGKTCGMHLVLEEARPIDLARELGEPSMRLQYSGKVPKSATDPEIPRWLDSLSLNLHEIENSRLAVSIEFGSSKENIGNIATGPVKSVIDCLYPILGGKPGKPEDWRIDALQVEKSVDSIDDNAIVLKIWAI